MAVSDGARLSWRQALAWRMARHHLIERAAPAELVRVAGDICGLHAQVLSAAELSLWARIDDLPRDAVQEALWRHRSLVKLWAARGTLYLLPAAELGAWLAALSTMPKFGNVGSAEVDALADAVGRALDGRVLTRAELAREVGRLTGSPQYAQWLRSSWGWALKAASFRGLVCFAPSQGRQVRFTSPASWLRGRLNLPAPADATREVARRFLGAYAPATAEDLARWWLGPPKARRVAPMLAALGDDAVQVDVEGRAAWALAADLPEIATAKPRNAARLLPAFDPWVVGADRRAPTLDARYLGRVFRPQGWISPVILVNGRIVGTWRHTRSGRRLAVELEPFEALPAWADRQLAAEVRRLATYLDSDIVRLEPPRRPEGGTSMPGARRARAPGWP